MLAVGCKCSSKQVEVTVSPLWPCHFAGDGDDATRMPSGVAPAFEAGAVRSINAAPFERRRNARAAFDDGQRNKVRARDAGMARQKARDAAGANWRSRRQRDRSPRLVDASKQCFSSRRAMQSRRQEARSEALARAGRHTTTVSRSPGRNGSEHPWHPSIPIALFSSLHSSGCLVPVAFAFATPGHE